MTSSKSRGYFMKNMRNFEISSNRSQTLRSSHVLPFEMVEWPLKMGIRKTAKGIPGGFTVWVQISSIFKEGFPAFVHKKQQTNQPTFQKTVGEIFISPRPKEHQFSTHVKFDARTPGGSHLFLRISPKDSPVWVIRRRSRRIRKNFLVQHVF